MLTEASVIDQITIDEHGNVSVRRSDRVLRNGVVIAQTYHRHIVEAGEPISPAEHQDVQTVRRALGLDKRAKRAPVVP